MNGRSPKALMVALLVVGSQVARANGRFPDAQQLVVDPLDPNHIAVQSTYGFIQTWDHGAEWRWMCEDAAGYGGVIDPPIAVLQDGTLIAGVFDGVSVSTDKGCNFAFAQAAGQSTCQANLTGLDGRYVVDVARQASDPARAIAVSSNGCMNNLFDTRLWETNDNAKTWAQAGVPMPQSFLALTGDVAPTDPNTVYASGFEVLSATSYVGKIARSKDRGATWELLEVPGSVNASAPYIGAIDPNDAKTFYVRLRSNAGRLLVTHDGGDSFTDVYTAKGKLLGFALSPDGKKLVIGGEDDGVLHASTSDLVFTQVSTIHNRCLTWWQDKVYGCASEAKDGFTIGESLDEGKTFTAIHHLSCLAGPIGCDAASAVSTLCKDPWVQVSETIATKTCASASSSATTSSAATGGPSDSGGADGCCSVAGSASRPLGGLAVGAGITIALLLGSRRRSRGAI